MAKNNTWIIVAILIVVIIIIGGNKGWFKLNSTYSTVNNYQGSGSSGGGGNGGGNADNTNINYQVTISINPLNACIGDIVTGIINSNMPNANCAIQYRFSNLEIWKTQSSVNLDSSGKYTQQAPVNTAGSVTFRVVCLLNGFYRVSNEQTVTVTDCSTSQPYNCFDSDNGINFIVGGNCQSNFDNLGHMDGCVDSETYMREYYCDDSGKCQWVPNTKWKCNQMACEQINPSGQPSCDLGNCLTGTCTYIPATLVAPAKCGCQGG